MPSLMKREGLFARFSFVAAMAAGAIVSAASAFANDCHSNPPRMTGLTELHTNCVPNCGFIIAHWSGPKDCDHYNIRERSGKQFEAPGTNRNQLYNQRSAQFPGRFAPNNTIHVAVQGCTKPIIGSSHCTNWSPEVSFFVDDGSGRGDSAKAKACRNYATRAVGTVKYAHDMHCDPAVISGPRWTSNFQEHLSWCMTANPNVANFEDRERARIAQECRIKAGMPQGTSRLRVTQPARGDKFTLTGSGYAPNARVIIRVSGPAGRAQAITTNFADAKGNFAVTLAGVVVCNKPGTVTFTAEDQDKPASPPVNATCRP